MDTRIKKLKKLAHELVIVDTVEIPFRSYVLDSCAMNYCGRYNKTWQCPPAVGTLEELKKSCLSYEKAVVFTTCHSLEDSFDIEGMEKGRIAHEKITDQAVEIFAGEEIKALSAEGCGLCEKCTYPTAPCRFPQKARSSVEANGISVVELAQNCNINYKNGENTVTYFSLILYKKKSFL